MLSDNPEESGLQYTNNGSTYTLTVVQRDVDDVNKNGDTTEPLPVALNVVTDTEPPVILAATLTGTVDGEYGEHDITPIHVIDPMIGEVLEVTRTVTVSINDTTGMILSITATDNAGISRVMWHIHSILVFFDWEDLIFDATSGTWQYIFNYIPYTGNHTICSKIIDVNGNAQYLFFNLVVTE